MTKIEIDGYKCFENFKIDKIKQINVITGLNNIGKTALLEAIHLGTNSDNSFRFLSCLFDIFSERGLYVNNYAKLNSLFQKNNLIEIYTDNNTLKVEKVKGAELTEEDKKLFMQSANIKDQDFFSLEKLDFFKYTDHLGKSEIGLISRVETMLNTLFDDHNYISSNNKYISSSTKHSNILKYFYEKVTSQFKEGDLLSSLQLIDERIEKLNIINDMLQVKLKSLSSYIPINELGDGFCRLVEILMDLYIAEHNTVVVDEIESGIHYSRIKSIWSDIITISRSNNIQLFVTTHSKEFIDRLSEVSRELDFDDVSIINLYKDKDGNVKHTMVDSIEILANRIDLGLENR
jgi:AAA15 family ATPase/GTPase